MCTVPRSALCLGLGVAIASPLTAAADRSDGRVLLNTRIPEASFVDVPFEQVCDWLGEYLEVSVVVRWQTLQDFGIRRDSPVSLRVRNLSAAQVLWLLLGEAGGGDVKLAYQAGGGLILISTHAELGQELLTRVYDVGDLLVRAPRFGNAPRLDVSQVLQIPQGGQASGPAAAPGGGTLFAPGNEAEEPAPPDDGAALVELIQAVIEPDAWKDTGGGPSTIRLFQGRLIVNAPLYVHQALGGAAPAE